MGDAAEHTAPRALHRRTAVGEAPDRLDLLLDACEAGDGEWNLQTGEVRFSERWTGMLGYATADLAPLILARWDAMCHPDDWLKLLVARDAVLSGHTDRWRVESRMRHRNGQWRCLEVRAVVMSRDAEGRPEWMCGAQFDNTAAREDEQRWRARADMSADWYWQSDEQHRVTRYEAGPRWADPQSRARFIGLRRNEFERVQPPSIGWDGFHAVLDQQRSFVGLGYGLLGDDQRLQTWVEIDGRPLFDAEGRFKGYEGIGRDVTQAQKAAIALRHSLEMIDLLFESIPVPVAQKDLAGRYTRVNRALCELFGVDPIQVLGQPTSALVSEASRAQHEAADQQLLRQGSGQLCYEARQRLRDGRHLDTLVTKSVLKDSDGVVIGLVATLVDISEMKRVERDLAEAKAAAESASEAKTTFLSTMSHEIRTPINGVMGMAEVLGRSLLDPEQSRMVQVILESGRGLLSVIDGVLDFSKIEAGKLQLEAEPVALEALTESVCDALEPLAQQNHVHLRPWVSIEVGQGVLADPTRLRQLLFNLIGNAIKFGAGQPGAPLPVDVRVWREDGLTCLRVSDQGIGMSADQLARLFSPFMQADASTTRRYGGTGLGLAICKRLVEAQAGRIEVHSTPGQGTRIEVRLPLPTGVLPAPYSAGPHESSLLAGVVCLLDAGEDDTRSTHGSDDIHQWLYRAGARLVRVDGLTALGPVHSTPDAPAVLVRLGARSAGRPALSDTALPVVRIVPGDALAPDLAAAGQPVVGRRRRWAVVQAVAHAAGRTLPAPTPTATPPAPLAPPGPLRRVLVAEDDPINQLVIQRQLSLLGFDVVVVGDGARAFALWREGDFSLLLTDLHMPALDGFALAAAVRRDERERVLPRRTPILALTASAFVSEARQATEAGIDDVLTKPVQMAVLQASLIRLMEGAARA